MSFFGSRLLPYPLPGPQPSEAGARRRTKAHREAVSKRKEIRIAPGGGRTLPGERERCLSTSPVPTPSSVTVAVSRPKSSDQRISAPRLHPAPSGHQRKNHNRAKTEKVRSLRLTESTVSVQAVKSVYLNKQVQSRFGG